MHRTYAPERCLTSTQLIPPPATRLMSRGKITRLCTRVKHPHVTCRSKGAADRQGEAGRGKFLLPCAPQEGAHGFSLWTTIQQEANGILFAVTFRNRTRNRYRSRKSTARKIRPLRAVVRHAIYILKVIACVSSMGSCFVSV